MMARGGFDPKSKSILRKQFKTQNIIRFLTVLKFQLGMESR
jgi:hypothetical protein